MYLDKFRIVCLFLGVKLEIEQPGLGYKNGNVPSPTPCTTRAPLVAPTRVYLPDGSYPDTIYNVSRSGRLIEHVH